MEKPDTKQFGRYEVVAELGRGAMGVVYKARDPQIDRIVAVKTVSMWGQEPEEEQEFRRLQSGVAGVKGSAEAGLVTISVNKQPWKNKFFRTSKEFRSGVNMVVFEKGLDKSFVIVDPCMVEPLEAIGIAVSDFRLYLIISPEGALRIIPVRCADKEGNVNAWSETMEHALIEGYDKWVRVFADMPNGSYRTFPAPPERYGAPNWPTIKPARIQRLAFGDRGLVIKAPDHVLFQKWAGRDRDA